MRNFGLAFLTALASVLLVIVSGGSLKLLVVAAVLIPTAALIALRPSTAVTVLFVTGVLLLDFSPLAVYRYFLVSDVLLVAAAAIQFSIDRSETIYFPALLTAAFAAFLAGLLGGIAAAQNLQGLATWIHFGVLGLVFLPALTTLMVRRPDLKSYLLGAIVVSALVQSGLVIAAVATGLDWRTGSRITGALGSFGLWVYAAAIVALVGLSISGRWPVKLTSLAGIGVLASAEMFLRSRMLWIASLLGICLMTVLQARHRISALLALGAVGALLVGVYAIEGYPSPIQRRITETLHPTQSGDLVARVQAVHDLVGAIEDSRGLGIGPGRSETYLRNLHSPSVVVNIHNIILHAAVEGGVVAAVGVVMIPLAVFALWQPAAALARDPLQRFLVRWEVSTLLAAIVAAQLTPTLYEHTFYALLAALASSAAGVRVPAGDPGAAAALFQG